VQFSKCITAVEELLLACFIGQEKYLAGTGSQPDQRIEEEIGQLNRANNIFAHLGDLTLAGLFQLGGDRGIQHIV